MSTLHRGLALGIVGALLVIAAVVDWRQPSPIPTVSSTPTPSLDVSSSPTPSPTTNPTPILFNDLLRVTNPLRNEVITSPLTVTGSARGTWYFEASFPIRLLDSTGKELAVAVAQAKTDWMTTDYVDFEAVVSFPMPSTSTGTLVIEKSNPSGLPANAQSLAIPVTLR